MSFAPKPTTVPRVATTRASTGRLGTGAGIDDPAAAVPKAASSSKPPAPKPLTLAEENALLRRENAEVRQQLLQLVAAANPTGGDARSSGPLPASFWLEAQLQHARRQVQLLSDALVNKSELTVDLEIVLLQLRSVENGPPAQWCRDSLRRIRAVQFAEEAAGEIVTARPRRTAAAGAGGTGSRPGGSTLGPGAAAARRGATTTAAARPDGRGQLLQARAPSV